MSTDSGRKEGTGRASRQEKGDKVGRESRTGGHGERWPGGRGGVGVQMRGEQEERGNVEPRLRKTKGKTGLNRAVEAGGGPKRRAQNGAGDRAGGL